MSSHNDNSNDILVNNNNINGDINNINNNVDNNDNSNLSGDHNESVKIDIGDNYIDNKNNEDIIKIDIEDKSDVFNCDNIHEDNNSDHGKSFVSINQSPENNINTSNNNNSIDNNINNNNSSNLIISNNNNNNIECNSGSNIGNSNINNNNGNNTENVNNNNIGSNMTIIDSNVENNETLSNNNNGQSSVSYQNNGINNKVIKTIHEKNIIKISENIANTNEKSNIFIEESNIDEYYIESPHLTFKVITYLILLIVFGFFVVEIYKIISSTEDYVNGLLNPLSFLRNITNDTINAVDSSSNDITVKIGHIFIIIIGSIVLSNILNMIIQFFLEYDLILVFSYCYILFTLLLGALFVFLHIKLYNVLKLGELLSLKIMDTINSTDTSNSTISTNSTNTSNSTISTNSTEVYRDGYSIKNFSKSFCVVLFYTLSVVAFLAIIILCVKLINKGIEVDGQICEDVAKCNKGNIKLRYFGGIISNTLGRIFIGSSIFLLYGRFIEYKSKDENGNGNDHDNATSENTYHFSSVSIYYFYFGIFITFYLKNLITNIVSCTVSIIYDYLYQNKEKYVDVNFFLKKYFLVSLTRCLGILSLKSCLHQIYLILMLILLFFIVSCTTLITLTIIIIITILLLELVYFSLLACTSCMSCCCSSSSFCCLTPYSCGDACHNGDFRILWAIPSIIFGCCSGGCSTAGCHSCSEKEMTECVSCECYRGFHVCIKI
eukprot:jgi/Orpsp1_1/1174202/evm.model.c7180000049255.1